MSETSATAMLVGTPDRAGVQPNAVTATVPRDEIEAAMMSEPPAELILDILRRTDDSEIERRTLNVAWSQEDLEALSRLPESDAVTFYFDPAELEQALDGEDVEGHGMREAAVALSIAAAAAVGAGSATAAVAPDASTSAANVAVGGHDEASLADRGIGVQTSAPAHDESTLTARGIESVTPAPSHDEASLAARGIETEPPAATRDEAFLASRGIEPGTVPASHDEASLTARGIEPGTVPASHDEASLTARGIEPTRVPASHDEASLTARGITPQAEPITVSDTGSGIDFPSVEPSTAAAVTGGLAGAGLLIAAAAFATRRRAVGHP
jgi:hypothetical protein